jgi:hypothetical protein
VLSSGARADLRVRVCRRPAPTGTGAYGAGTAVGGVGGMTWCNAQPDVSSGVTASAAASAAAASFLLLLLAIIERAFLGGCIAAGLQLPPRPDVNAITGAADRF